MTTTDDSAARAARPSTRRGPGKGQDEREPPFEARVPGIDYGVLDALLGYALRRAQLKLYEDFIRSLAPWNITPPRFSALVLIANNPDLKLTDLSRILNVARSGAVTVVDALSELGYVERHASATDKRAYRLLLTPRGKKALTQITRAVHEHDRRIVSMLTAPEQTQLMSLLARMVGSSEPARKPR
jgi:DNA-binding MarR family transcriptional regulator